MFTRGRNWLLKCAHGIENRMMWCTAVCFSNFWNRDRHTVEHKSTTAKESEKNGSGAFGYGISGSRSRVKFRSVEAASKKENKKKKKYKGD